MPSGPDRSVAEVVKRASGRLDENGWCQFDLALSHGDDSPPQLCLDAALLYGVGITIPSTSWVRTDQSGLAHHIAGATWRHPLPGPDVGAVLLRHLSRGRRNKYLAAVRYMQEVTGASDLANWNDEVYRSIEEVQDALRQAHELALERGE